MHPFVNNFLRILSLGTIPTFEMIFGFPLRYLYSEERMKYEQLVLEEMRHLAKKVGKAAIRQDELLLGMGEKRTDPAYLNESVIWHKRDWAEAKSILSRDLQRQIPHWSEEEPYKSWAARNKKPKA